MSTARPEIHQILVRLRRTIRRYLLWEGLAAVIGLACLLFWMTYLVDIAYFEVSSLELPRWFRLVSAVGMAVAIAGLVITWLTARQFRKLDQEDLALVLERRFPELNDRLITAVELSARSDSDLHVAMLDRTINEAVDRLSTIPLEQTINPKPLRRTLIIAGTLLASVLVVGIADAKGVNRWYNAYVLNRDDYWGPFRQNALQLTVVAQPGDRVRKLSSGEIYKHPRGADLELIAESLEDATPPDLADLQFVSVGASGRKRGRVTMSPSRDGEFRQTLSRVVSDHELWIRAGDFVNRSPFRIQVVDPPQVERIQLQCDYPSYTGMDSLEDQPVSVVGTQVSLPMETAFDLNVQINKPLVRANIRSSRFDLTIAMQPQGDEFVSLQPTLTILDPESGRRREVSGNQLIANWFDADRNCFTIPFQLSTKAADELTKMTEFPIPIPLPPDEPLQISLVDDDDIYSQEPANLIGLGTVDRPPVVETRRTGVGTEVTRMASLPIEGRITDDYGVRRGWFSYKVDENDAKEQPLTRQPSGQREFSLREDADREHERFALIPLELQVGQTLSLTVHGEDGDILNGPHSAHGETFVFKIVSNEDLLARLYDREVNLRLRFEQIRAEVDATRIALTDTRDQLEALQVESTERKTSPAILIANVDRSLHQIRKNHTESRSIEVSFRDLREEMVNNRVDTAELLERISRGVIEPLSLLNSIDFIEVDRRLGAYRLALDRGLDAKPAASEVQTAIDELIAGMDAILAEMKERGTYNELIQNLQEMIDRQKELLEKTENKRIEENFFGDVFE